MKKIIATVISTTLSFCALSAQASTHDCKNVSIKHVYVEGPRDDNFEFQNKLIIQLDGNCYGRSYLHADLHHPAFDGFLAVALQAKAYNLRANVSINTSKSTSRSYQIAYVGI